MGNQELFNMVVSIAGFLAVWVFTTLMQRVQKIEDRLNNLPKEYVVKDDYKDDIKEVKDILKQIFEKLDNKADK